MPILAKQISNLGDQHANTVKAITSSSNDILNTLNNELWVLKINTVNHCLHNIVHTGVTFFFKKKKKDVIFILAGYH